MKVTEHFKKAKQTLFSFEILPPLKGTSIQSIYDSLDPLMEFNPPFIDVTYHREEVVYKKRENGLLESHAVRKRPGTVGICAAIMNKYQVDTVPHIICGGFNKEETENALIAILKPVINSDSFWKPHSLLLLGDYFLSKGEKQKAKDFYSQIFKSQISDKNIFNQAQQRMLRNYSE